MSEYLKTLMLKKYRITDTGSSGVKKFLSQKIIEEYKSLKLPEYWYHLPQLKMGVDVRQLFKDPAVEDRNAFLISKGV